MFAEEKPCLLPYWSLPPGWIRRLIKVQWDESTRASCNTSQLLHEHLRQKRGGYRIQEEGHPKKMPLSTAQLLRRTEHAGAAIGKFCQLIYQQQGEIGIRRMLGTLSLMKKYGPWQSKMPSPPRSTSRP